MRAFECDMTGEMVKGNGIKEIVVDVSDTLRLKVTPLVSTGGQSFAQGEISEAAAANIIAAMQKLGKPSATPSKE